MSSMFDMQVVKGSGVAMPGDMNLPRPRFAVGTRVSLPTWKNELDRHVLSRCDAADGRRLQGTHRTMACHGDVR